MLYRIIYSESSQLTNNSINNDYKLTTTTIAIIPGQTNKIVFSFPSSNLSLEDEQCALNPSRLLFRFYEVNDFY